MLERRDYVMRLVKQFAEAVARALARALVDPAQARADLDVAAEAAVGLPVGPLLLVDAHTVVQMLDATRAVALAEYVEARGQLEAMAVRSAAARGHFLHALELVHATLERAPSHAAALALATRLRDRLA